MAAKAPRQICTFVIDGTLFGVDVTRVQEVIRYQEMTPVPLAPPTVSGLINLRGQIVTAIDMRARLGVAGRLPQPMNVVIKRGEGAVSLLVDEIGDVVEVDEDSFERPPETMRGQATELVLGIYKLKQQLLLLLDTERAVELGSQTSSEGSEHAQR